MRFDLSDEEWALLEPLLPKSRKSVRVDDRKIVNAIFYVLRTGMPLAGLAGTLRSLHDGIQSLQRKRRFGPTFRIDAGSVSLRSDLDR